MKSAKPIITLIVAGFLLSLTSGCASYLARKRLEGVAKGWCQTIRASQVIPVYPLTEDLVVGDVFLVQTPIASQASLYRKKGFLALDDAKVRLPHTNFSQVYFDGYWKDEFGKTPHVAPGFVVTNNAHSTKLTAAPLPRAAFPTYSFKAQSGFGVNAAFPIQGVPVALSYLNSGKVDGTVTIADARTYAGDPDTLHSLLKSWAASHRDELADVAASVAPTKVYLRVVTRVYLARSLDVTLHRADSQGAAGRGGTVNEVAMVNPDGTLNQNYTNLLNSLNATPNLLEQATEVGAAAKFVAASESTVGLSQSFDRLLAIGYLGFDVPVTPSGDIGVPIPTFQHLEGKISASATHFGQDENTARIRTWLRKDDQNKENLRAWLDSEGYIDYGIANILNGSRFAKARKKVVAELVQE